jgi:glycerate kinase
MSLVVLVSPAAFKGTLGPRTVAAALAGGVRRAAPDAVVLECPVADGGNGLLDVVLPTGALRERLPFAGPVRETVSAELGWIDNKTAIFESASACGLALVEPEERDPLRTTTRGVGELIWTAADRGAKTIVVGLGGSATVDGGTGAARGLGWTFQSSVGAVLEEGGGSLADLGSLGRGWGLGEGTRVVALADVDTPLLGDHGAAPVFGPQKGARPDEIPRLAAGLERLAALWAAGGRPDLGTLPMGGAAGGLGAGLVYFAGADLVRGADWVFARIGFDAALAKADLVLTAEGVFDRTSLVGKATGEVVRRAQAARKKVAVVAGRVENLIGVHAVGGVDGRMLDAAALTGMAEQVAREALHL